MRSKTLYDAIHGFIEFNPLEGKLLATKPMRRLESIHQMGSAYFVYPTARHTRFEHSLGVMQIATKMYDHLTQKTSCDQVPQVGSSAHRYWRQILRFAALCHDIGHLPFSHTGEVLLGDEGHEAWSLKLIRGKYLEPIWKEFGGGKVAEDIAKLAVGQLHYPHPLTPWETILSEIITGDVFGADRLDYLIRDSYFTGLSYGKVDHEQIIHMLCITNNSKNRLTLGVYEAGVDACDFLLIGRHFMYKRVYHYPAVMALKFHFVRFLKIFFSDKCFLDNEDVYLSWTDHEILSELNKALDDCTHTGHADARAIFDRQFRYSVFSITKEEMERLGQQAPIPEEGIIFEENNPTLNKTSLLFPVIRKNGIIDRSDYISDFSIRSKLKNWVYVAPEYEQTFFQLIAQCIG